MTCQTTVPNKIESEIQAERYLLGGIDLIMMTHFSFQNLLAGDLRNLVI